MKSKTCFVFLMSTILALSPALAGVVFNVETTYHSSSAAGRGPENSQMSAEGTNFKMEILPTESGGIKDEVLFRGERRQIVFVDHKDKSYVVMDEESMRELAGMVGGMMSQMQEALKNVPEAERRKIEEMMKQRMPSASPAPARPAIEAHGTGERQTRQGYPCVKYDVLRNGQKIQELWVTDWGNIKGGRQIRETFGQMADFFRGLQETVTQGLPGGLAGADDSMFRLIKTVDGFPVVTRDFEGGELESETVLESVTERDLDPDAFEPPKGYRLRTMGPR